MRVAELLCTVLFLVHFIDLKVTSYIYGHHVMYDIRIMSYMTCGVQYALKFFVLVCQLLSLFISDEDFSFKKHHDIVEAKRSNMNFTNSAKNKCLCSY